MDGADVIADFFRPDPVRRVAGAGAGRHEATPASPVAARDTADIEIAAADAAAGEPGAAHAAAGEPGAAHAAGGEGAVTPGV
ncbi:hypothetical protein CEK29_14525 [Bordetella genomosp. 5]|uniref:hypothetical protein n=1 Tax=Bordetella genomosp. 5 TaxID=1395608 RepID=UPI000B9DE02E|nr:hypothetical protein [Bordetella genomosp. 5]OZI42279.1 hypothetical protein CEK29_14525 [Bordetella genomosp. 5]